MSGLSGMPGSDRPPVLRLHDSVLLSGPAVLWAARLVALGVRSTVSRDGISPGAGLLRLEAELAAAADLVRQMSAAGQRDVLDRMASSGCLVSEQIGSVEVAEVLGLSPRQVSRLAPELGAVRVGGRYVYDREVVEAFAEERRRDQQMSNDTTRGAA